MREDAKDEDEDQEHDEHDEMKMKTYRHNGHVFWSLNRRESGGYSCLSRCSFLSTRDKDSKRQARYR